MMVMVMMVMMIVMMVMMVMMIMTTLTSIPDPGTIEPLDHKLPKDIGSEGADFTLKCLDKVPLIMMMTIKQRNTKGPILPNDNNNWSN